MTTEQHVPSEHSDVVGGSTAGRIMACPGSYKMLQALYEQQPGLLEQDDGNDASRRGTALHEAIAWWLDHEERPDIRSLEGETFCVGKPEQRTIDQDDIVDALLPAALAFENFAALCDHEGGFGFDIEQRVELKGIPGAFGTSDIIGRTARRTVVWDWKFGFKKVSPVENAQGLFYATAGMLTEATADLFGTDDDWPVEIVICQPADDEQPKEGYKRWSTTVGELKRFRSELTKRVAEAMSDDPAINRGDHCAFQPCRAICPLHRAPLARLADASQTLGALQANGQDVATAELAPDANGYDPIALTLGDILDLKELVTPFFDAAEAMAHQRLEAGLPVYGRKLAPKRAMRKGWTDDRKAASVLRRSGLKKADYMTTPVLVSPAQAEKALKAAKITLDEKLAKQFKDLSPATSSGSTIAPWDDPRPTIADPAAKLAELANKLAAR